MAEDGRRDESIEAAERALWSSIASGAALDAAAKRRGRIMELMQEYLRRVGIEDAARTLPVVHIAGTKGKGSTACMVESMLRARGLRTGLFTSPHLVTFRERFRLNGRPMEESVFLGHFWRVWDALAAAARAKKAGDGAATDGVPDVPGFFHLLTVLALAAFSAERVDVLVLEVGLGGRLDATNVVERPVVCGVATLDYDHVEVLGGTIAAIAREKAGIFKRGRPVWSVPQLDGATPELDAAAARVGCPLAVVDPEAALARGAEGGSPLAVGPDGAYQRVNAALAIALAETFLVATGRAAASETSVPAAMLGGEAVGRVEAAEAAAPPLAADLASGLGAAHWPGRAHSLGVRVTGGGVAALPRPADAGLGDVVALLDGAHTAASMTEAVSWFGERAPAGAARTLVFGCGQEKDAVQLMLPLAAAGWDAVLVCPLAASRPSRRAAPTADGLVRRYLERCDEAKGRSPPADTSRAEAGAHAGSGGGGGAATGDAGPSWVETLCQVWRAVAVDPRLEEARGRHGVAGASTEASTVGSIGDALRAAARPGRTASCMVTGSLYLVGDCLKVTGWEP